jgi:hypothetical protein
MIIANVVAGSAPRSGRGGRRFKSCHSDHDLAEIKNASATPCATLCSDDDSSVDFCYCWLRDRSAPARYTPRAVRILIDGRVPDLLVVGRSL